MKEDSFKITGMTCDGCARVVKTVLSKVEGVKNVNVDLSSNSATIESESGVSRERLNEALKATAYRIEQE